MLREQLVGRQHTVNIATMYSHRDPHVEELRALDDLAVKTQKIEVVERLQRVANRACQIKTGIRCPAESYK